MTENKPRLKTAGPAVTVSSTTDLRNALAAGYSPEQIEIKPAPAPAAAPTPAPQINAEAIAAHVAKMPPTELAKAAALAERQRIAAIEAATPEGFAALKARAIAEGLDPGQYAIALLSETKDRGITMAGIRADSPQPAPHGGLGEAKPEDSLMRTAREMGLAR
jgi:capsid assembly protease